MATYRKHLRPAPRPTDSAEDCGASNDAAALAEAEAARQAAMLNHPSNFLRRAAKEANPFIAPRAS